MSIRRRAWRGLLFLLCMSLVLVAARMFVSLLQS
jgi:hypothetical protein